VNSSTSRWHSSQRIHYIYGYRKAADEARARQLKVETYAERTKELV
jgi:hypothetical protein